MCATALTCRGKMTKRNGTLLFVVNTTNYGNACTQGCVEYGLLKGGRWRATRAPLPSPTSYSDSRSPATSHRSLCIPSGRASRGRASWACFDMLQLRCFRQCPLPPTNDKTNVLITPASSNVSRFAASRAVSSDSHPPFGRTHFPLVWWDETIKIELSLITAQLTGDSSPWFSPHDKSRFSIVPLLLSSFSCF